MPVDLAPDTPATLVIGYRTAVRILHDPQHFPADPRGWQATVSPACPVLPAMGWRPGVMRNSGVAHARYRRAVTDAVAAIDLHSLDATVERIAEPLIEAFREDGEADLIAQYALPVAFTVINSILGVPTEIGRRVAVGLAAMLETVDGASRGNAEVYEALTELLALKQELPGDDVTTRLLRHSACLDEQEVVENVLMLYGAGIEPQQNLVANTLLLMLTDERFAGGILGGSLSTRDALDEVLFADPPVANFCMSYPRQPILIEDTWLPAHQPVLISMAACNNDPSLGRGENGGNRSHLAWGVGPHACPATSMAYLIAQDAINQLLDALPEVRLAVASTDLVWRPGPFHRALTSLPVQFPPCRPPGR
ncbi:cytochrome P450 [Nocardia pseudovaccinii]|uniref:cytochrome P450 n=1 Tax=Nocardia pseudovaccinii TaxID=189540 RepID=UPI003D8DB20A